MEGLPAFGGFTRLRRAHKFAALVFREEFNGINKAGFVGQKFVGVAGVAIMAGFFLNSNKPDTVFLDLINQWIIAVE